MVTINLFVIFTSAHIFHARNIIKSESLDNNHFIVTTNALAEELSTEPTVSIIGRIYPINLIQITKLKNKIARSDVSYRIIVPHFMNVTSQAIYHVTKSQNKLLETAIMPDGNLLFNGFVTKLTSPVNWLRKIKATLLLSKYELLNGDICTVGTEVSIVYSYMSNTRFNRSDRYQVKIIKMPQQEVSGKPGLLILGHYNQRSISAKALYQSIEQLIMRFEVVVYKPHPRLNIRRDLFLQILRKNCGFLTVCTASESAESFVSNNLGVSTVFAVGSSSLINLKLMQPMLDIYCCAMEEYFQEHYDERLRENIEQLKINILPFEDATND